MKKLGFLFITVMVICSFLLSTQAPVWAKEQTACPIMGAPINKSIYVDHNGKRVYFCCKGCPETFKKDPEYYIKKLEAEGVELEKAPAAPEKKM